MREQKLQCPGQGPLALMFNASCGRCCRWCEGLGKRGTPGERALGRAQGASPEGGTGGESWGKLKVEGQGAGSLGRVRGGSVSPGRIQKPLSALTPLGHQVSPR